MLTALVYNIVVNILHFVGYIDFTADITVVGEINHVREKGILNRMADETPKNVGEPLEGFAKFGVIYGLMRGNPCMQWQAC